MKLSEVRTLAEKVEERRVKGTFAKGHVKPSKELKCAGRIQETVINRAESIYGKCQNVALFGGFNLITLENIPN